MALIDNLIAYWKLDGNNTESVASLSGTDTAISYDNAYGKINQGALFNGTSSKIVVANSTAFDVSAVTINFWFKLSSAQLTQYGTIFEKGAVNSQYTIRIEQYTGNYGFNFLLNAGGAANWYVPWTTLGVVADTWYMATAWFNGTVRKIYINGVEKATQNYTATLPTGNSGETIGQYGGGGGFYYNGYLDELGVWSRAITTTEVTALYNSGNGVQYPFSAGGPAKLKTWNGVAKAKIKTINGVPIAKWKSWNGVA